MAGKLEFTDDKNIQSNSGWRFILPNYDLLKQIYDKLRAGTSFKELSELFPEFARSFEAMERIFTKPAIDASSIDGIYKVPSTNVYSTGWFIEFR